MLYEFGWLLNAEIPLVLIRLAMKIKHHEGWVSLVEC
jgi:hypothetical protein